MTTTTSPVSTASLGGTVRAGGTSPTWLRRLIRGSATTARWERPSFLGLLLVSAVLYLWNLSSSGWANSFYSAAVQAGASNWEAFFYGSSDAANSITVDKPPMSLWFMELSVRLFGLSSFSILLPEALMGVATVGVVYLTVRRSFSARTALLAGGVLAVTPVAALMFRFNNPDALLVLLMSLSVYFTVPRHPEWQAALGALGRRDGRVRLPDEAASGRRHPACARRHLPGRRSRQLVASSVAPAARARRGHRLGRMVGCDRHAGSGEHEAVHRRLADQ